MGRYAVINSDGVVENVVEWDGVAPWQPPEGCTVKPHEQVGRNDIWLESIQEFVRPMSMLTPPLDEISLAARAKAFEAAKAKLKSGLLLINDTGAHEAI